MLQLSTGGLCWDCKERFIEVPLVPEGHAITLSPAKGRLKAQVRVKPGVGRA